MEEKISKKMNVTAIVPSYEPDEKLIGVVTGLYNSGFTDIIVVNDGSSAENLSFFPKEGSIPGYVLLSHDTNKGKGAALKTAFEYYRTHTPQDSIGVVAVDGDGQHKIEDVIACCEALENNPDNIILGVRDFSAKHVPPRSRAGNKITAGVFSLFCGIKISDTQTGLRAIPRSCIDTMLKISGDRYEYETNMLLDMKNYHIEHKEVKINTVYIDQNQTSHFRTVRDSIRIYMLIIKYLSSSAIAAIVDALVFFLLTVAFEGFFKEYSVFVCTLIARVASSLVNFLLNRQIFGSRGSIMRTALKYYILAAATMSLSACIVYGLKLLMRVSAPLLQTLIKIIVDTILFFFNFRVQKMWVFKK